MICYVLAMGKQQQDRTWLWDMALKFFGWAFSLRHQITWLVGDIIVDIEIMLNKIQNKMLSVVTSRENQIYR